MPCARAPSFDLTGKVALVTGGSAGIGAAIAEALGAHGATVVIAARRTERAELRATAFRTVGIDACSLPLDLADPASCDRLIPAVAERFGRLDILVNNAGMGFSGLPQDTTLAEWRTVLDVNLTGAFLLCKAAYPGFCGLGGGKIINIGSIATRLGSGHAVAYGVSKGGIGQLTRSLAAAWGPDNIQVNALLPGYIETDLVAKTRTERPEFDRRVTERTPLRRFGRPADIAGAALLLASPASDFMTGELIAVDGGYSIQL